MTKLSYITSFNKKLYAASGRALVESFLDKRVEGTLSCFVEGDVSLPDHPSISGYSIDDDPLLKKVLEENVDVIPREYGGKHDGKCTCRNKKQHRPRCPKLWWNENFSRWFRKVVALNRAVHETPADIFIWVDCDCEFQQSLNIATVEGWFSGRSVFYLRHRRKHPETGLVGYDLRKQGAQFILALADRFESKAFRKDDRWDDCWQFMMVQQNFPTIDTIDIATGIAHRSQVIPMSPAGPYFVHDKGSHRRKRAYQ